MTRGKILKKGEGGSKNRNEGVMDRKKKTGDQRVSAGK